MKSAFQINDFRLQLIGLSALFLSGCGMITTASPSDSCDSGAAQIMVTETGMQRVCGCSEGSGTFGAGASFNCTVSAGTKVWFVYSLSNPSNNHQVIVQGMLPSFQVRTADGTTPSDLYNANSTGNITFQDIFTTTGGTLIVL